MHVTNCLNFVYIFRLEKANVQVITRSRTGNLPPARTITEVTLDNVNKVSVTSKATPEEIKEKMEQQLRIQRAAHQQKRAMESKNPGSIIKMLGTTAQGKFLFLFNFYFLYNG